MAETTSVLRKKRGNSLKSSNLFPSANFMKKIVDISETSNPRTIKRILIEIRGHKCEYCGNAEWLGKPITLELEHVDGNSDNNDKENLKIICPNCHSQTLTYKSKNRSTESSRKKIRRERYVKVGYGNVGKSRPVS